MSKRFVAALALLLVGAFLQAGAKPPDLPLDDPIQCQEEQPKPVTKVYAVADLVLPVAKPASSADVAEPTGQTLETALIKLITTTVAPQSWSIMGGPGTIDYFPIGMALVVNQTPDVQEQVADLLASLRRLQDVEVAVEMRWITLPDSLLDCPEVGSVWYPVESQSTPGDSIRMTFLNASQVSQYMETIQKDKRTNIVQAPKLTLFNGQTSTMNLTEARQFVSGIQVNQEKGQFLCLPNTEVLTIGHRATIEAVVSEDQRFVRLHLQACKTSLETDPVPLIPVTTFVPVVREDGAQGQPMPYTQYIQKPRLIKAALDKVVSMPDGGTVLFSGWKASKETSESGPPVLSKIPYINRLFQNVKYSPEHETVVLMVTPHIVIQKEEEEKGLTEYTCPYLKAKAAEQVQPPQVQVAQPGTVMENLAALEQARKAFQRAEKERRHGRADRACQAYEEVQRLCPASRYDRMAAARCRQLQAQEASQATAGSSEEQDQSGWYRGPCLRQVSAANNAKKVAELLEKYQQACAAGHGAEATQLAIQALALDPACFSKEHVPLNHDR